MEVNQFMKSSTSPTILTNLFPNQDTHIVSRDPSSSNTILMLFSRKPNSDFMVDTWNKDYGNVNPLNSQATNQHTNLTSPSSNPTLPMITMELTIKPLKGIIHKSAFNPCAKAAQNYNVVEDFAQSSSAMLTLELLKNCPTQKRVLLLDIRCVDPSDSNLVFSSHENYTSRLLAQLAFII